MSMAPLALAFERYLECRIFEKLPFDKPILDIGCGDGLLAFVLFNERIDVGIDPDARELNRAKQYGKYKELIQCHGSDIPISSESFNVIVSNSVLEHIQELQPVLNESYRLLAPGGRFFITVPTDMFEEFTAIYQILCGLGLKTLSEKYRKLFNKFWMHFHHYRKEEWKKIFEDAGFKIIESKEYKSKIICLICDLLVPFAFPSFIVKRLLNRWIISKSLRTIYIYPFYLLVRTIIRRYESNQKGGLIFFSLVKE
jgi:ubiquinone/menaquinone biosynthesis C-methylase UbiE